MSDARPGEGAPSPTLLRTIRPPLGPGNDGAVSAVALSPDGRWIAAGVWDPRHTVYIYDAANGRIVERLTDLGNVVRDLTFSPDGSQLAAVLAFGFGMRVWRTSDWSWIAADGAGNRESYGAAFDGKGRLWTVAYDGKLRRYGDNFESRSSGSI